MSQRSLAVVAEQLVLFTAEEARRLTDEVKADAAALWSKLLRLYEGGAHTALGYPSWGAYYEAEFGQSGMRGHQLLQAARVLQALEPVNNCLPSSEAVARELTPLRDAPDLMREAWSEAIAEHGPQPTAAEVREHALVLQSMQLRRYWHTPVVRFAPGGWTLSFVPRAQLPPGLGGDHARLPNLTPEARVGVQRLMQQIGDRTVPAWEVEASHELLEMLVDPTGGGREICDPVQFDGYLIDGVGVSAFVTPDGREIDHRRGEL